MNYIKNKLFLDALAQKPLATPPIWMMRQAGRYLPEYRKVREKAGSFLALCQNPELACEVTLQPLERFKMDAAILFSDILTVPEAMGMDLKFIQNEGPVFSNPIKSLKDVQNLNKNHAIENLEYVFNTVKTIKSALLNAEKLEYSVPLIGFSGSPWTLAVYMIEGRGSKQFSIARSMIYKAPEILHLLLEYLTEVVTEYLSYQIQSGCDVIQIFDTWGGLLTPDLYNKCSLFYMKKIIQKLKSKHPKTPIILFTKNGGLWLDQILKSDADAIGLDWTINPQTAISMAEKMNVNMAFQGNLDPAVLYGSEKLIISEAERLKNSFYNAKGWVCNLGHGFYPDINPEKVKIFIDAVRGV